MLLSQIGAISSKDITKPARGTKNRRFALVFRPLLAALYASTRNTEKLKTWLDYEERFRNLAPRLQHSRIDDQTGAAGEHWRIAGLTNDKEALHEFDTLCTIAGRKATEALKENSSFSDSLDHKDPRIRWYRLLKTHSTSYERGPSGYETNEDGSKQWSHVGTISNIGEGSANLCFWLEAHFPITQPWYKTLYEDYGKGIIVGVILIVVSSIFVA